MKKRDLFLAGALLLGFGLNAQAQSADEQLFFFGFEDGLASFQDSSTARDSITEIRYYDGTISNGTSGYPSDLTIAYVKDSTMLLLNGLSPLRSRGDEFEIISDPLGGHQADMEAMGAQGGQNYFKYTSGGEFGGSNCNDYEANLFVRGIMLDDNTSYRLVFYTKASSAEAQVNAGVFRGYYNSEKPISMNGSSGNEFYLTKQEFTTDRWERNTVMMFYQNDSVANRHMYTAGYWWTNSWAATDPETGKQYNRIEQFDKYFFRMSFMAPGVTYYLDDISLYKSTIGGAEFNGDLLRVDFGYDTNLGEIAAADPAGAVELPGEYFSLTAEYGGEPYDLEVMSAEYHDDGYLYIWLNDDSFEGLDNVRLSLQNPDDPALQLKYDGSLYPYSLDTVWVNEGKIVPDFENEFAVYNPEVFAVSRLYIAPIMKQTSPESGSFNLDPATETVDVTFSKEIYANVTAGTADDYNVIIRMKSSKGEEVWTPCAYDEETFTVTFKRPAGLAALNGDCDFTIMNARAGSGDQFQPAKNETFTLTFGDLSTAGRPTYFYMSEEEWGKSENAHQCIPLGWIAYDSTIGSAGQVGTGEAVSGRTRMFHHPAGGDFTRGFYSSPRGSSVAGTISYGAVEGYSLVLDEGSYWLSFKIFGWGSTPNVYAYVYPLGEERPTTYIGKFQATPNISATNGQSSSYVITGSAEYRLAFDIAEKNNYVMEFVIPTSEGWNGFCVGAIELSNQYSEAFKYLKMLEDAQAAANVVLANSQADSKYSGEYLDTFKGVIDEYADFKDTAPSAYENATQTIKDATSAMNERIGIVDKFYTEYAAAQEKEAIYTDSTYNQLVAYRELKAKIEEYDGLDVTVKDNDALTAITTEVSDATKAMTDRCDAMDKFTGLKADLKQLFVDYADYDFTSEFQNAQTAYNNNKDLDLIAADDDALSTANSDMDAAKTAFNNKMNAASLLTKQDKALKGIAEDLDVTLDADAQALIDAVMPTLLEDDQNVANLYQLAIKAKVCEMIDADELDSELDLTHFVQNASFYNVNSSSSKIHNNENPLPGWNVISGSNNDYLRDRSNNGANAYTSEAGNAVNSGIGLDWNSSVKMNQTIKNLPAGKYTFNYYQGAWGTPSATTTEGGFIFIQKGEAGDTIALDTIVMYAGGTGEVTLLGGEVELLLDLTTKSTWEFIDDLELIFTEPLAGYDYAAAAAAAAAAIEDAKTGVAPVMEAADVKYYNLNGVRTAQPNGVSIKVTTGKNGARKVEKVLVK